MPETRPIDPELLSILVCPETHQPLAEADAALVESVNARIAAGTQKNVGGEAVEVTATEFNLLVLLMRRRGRVQTRERLLQDVWDYDSIIDTRTVDTHMRRLREKLGEAAEYLGTVRGVGYRFVAD